MITKNVQLEKLGEKLEKNLNAKFTKKDVAKIYDLVEEVIEEGILEGGVKVGKLFTVTVAERAARQGRNPQTGEKLSIPAKKVARFKASKNLALTSITIANFSIDFVELLINSTKSTINFGGRFSIQ